MKMQEIQAAFDRQDYATVIALGLVECAQDGIREAQEILGNCYQLGLGLQPEMTLAIYWYEVAIANGSGLAANNLATITSMGYDGHPADRQKAQAFLDKAHELGFDHAPKRMF